MADDQHPAYAPFFGAMGAASAMVFSGMFCVLFYASVIYSVLLVINETRFEVAVIGSYRVPTSLSIFS